MRAMRQIQVNLLKLVTNHGPVCLRKVGKAVIPLAILLLLASTSLAQGGSSYDLSWWTVDGGGTVSSSGAGYALSGAIGQPDADVWNGNGYTLVGGFWGGASVEYGIYLPLVLKGN
jgi:hypothetical protein